MSYMKEIDINRRNDMPIKHRYCGVDNLDKEPEISSEELADDVYAFLANGGEVEVKI